MKLSPLFDATS